MLCGAQVEVSNVAQVQEELNRKREAQRYDAKIGAVLQVSNTSWHTST